MPNDGIFLKVKVKGFVKGLSWRGTKKNIFV